MEEIGGSEYLKVIYGQVTGIPPRCDLTKEKKLQEFTLAAIKEGLVISAHDISEGGFVTALIESCISEPEKVIGAEVKIEGSREDFVFFSETQGRIIFSINPESMPQFQSIAHKYGVPVKLVGKTGGNSVKINKLEFKLNELKEIYYDTIPEIMA
jgi:phosphoribosylformylglycinamidine synthase